MTDEKEPDEIGKSGPALSADGTLEGRFGRVESAGAQPEERLELADVAPRVREPRIEVFRPVQAARSPTQRLAFKFVLALALVGLLGLGALLYLQPKLDAFEVPEGVRESTLFDSLGSSQHPLIISSNPTGATIVIEGTTIGQTPWAGENRWVGSPKLVLRRPGYKDWQGTFTGDQPQTLDVQLKK